MTKVALRLTDAGFHRTLVFQDRRFSNGIAKVLLFSIHATLKRKKLLIKMTPKVQHTGNQSIYHCKKHIDFFYRRTIRKYFIAE